ncbi:MAG: HAD hydrolase family protein [Polyangiaceae bacterium]|nr:HAD hydrolase family protein [Polyangiaceae bacterium]
MLPIAALTAEEARRIDTLVFDLDDTVLDHGRLGEAAYRALFRLREAGLDLVASTGRPAGWAEIVARQWPIAAALAENGAVAWTTRSEDGRVHLVDTVGPEERRERHARLVAIADDLVALHGLELADDNAARRTDITFDIGEHRHVDPSVVSAARTHAQSLGARTFLSSVHLHITFEGFDKASGYARWASSVRGDDPTRALWLAGFVGDSGNDASAFAAFGITFAVANVRRHLGQLTVRPRFVADHAMGAGFAQIADALARLRSS